MIQPTRLREIASLLELNCVENRKRIQGVYIPCSSCKKAAEELRMEALLIGPPQAKSVAVGFTSPAQEIVLSDAL